MRDDTSQPPARRRASGSARMTEDSRINAATAFAAAALVRGAYPPPLPVGAYPQPPSSSPSACTAGPGRSVAPPRTRPMGAYFSSDDDEADAGLLDRESDSALAGESMDWSELSSSLPPSNFSASLTPSGSNWDMAAVGVGPGSRGQHQHIYPGCSAQLPPGRLRLVPPPGLVAQLPGSKFADRQPESLDSSRQASHDGSMERLSAGQRPPQLLSAILERDAGSGSEACPDTDKWGTGSSSSGRRGDGSLGANAGDRGRGRHPSGERRPRRSSPSRLSCSSQQLPGMSEEGPIEEEGAQLGIAGRQPSSSSGQQRSLSVQWEEQQAHRPSLVPAV